MYFVGVIMHWCMTASYNFKLKYNYQHFCEITCVIVYTNTDKKCKNNIIKLTKQKKLICDPALLNEAL